LALAIGYAKRELLAVGSLAFALKKYDVIGENGLFFRHEPKSMRQKIKLDGHRLHRG